MDVNEQAVADVLSKHDILLHGHTHRPAVHEYANHKKRIVLGDWREDNHTNSGEAMIALLDENGLDLLKWQF